VSINSFGFGGSNTHVILEDALHYLKGRGLQGNHCTAAIPEPMAKTHGVVIQGATLVKVPREINGIHGAISRDSCNSTIHAKRTVAATRSTQVSGVSANGIIINGSAANRTTAHRKSHEAKVPDISTSPSQNHKLLIFSAFDERAAQRTIEGYSSWYETNKIASDYKRLHALAYTLAARRDHMRWRSFAITDTPKDVLYPFRPVRVVSEPSLYWAFTGQGAQYVDMGWELIGTYSVFENILKKVDKVYMDLGCEWSIFGECRKYRPPPTQSTFASYPFPLFQFPISFGIICG
jgi:acyl transferase domain-containing protein